MRLLSIVATLLLLSACTTYETKLVSVNGHSIDYQLSGSNSSCLVLFEAGMGFDLAVWDDIYDETAKSCTTLRYSRPGQGDSAELEGNLSTVQYAELAKDLLDTLNLSQAVIYVGHSYGGSIARHFAKQYPDRTQALLLVDPATEWEEAILMQLNKEKAQAELAEVRKFGFEWAEGRSNGTLSEMTDFWKKLPLPTFNEIGDIPVAMVVSTKKLPGPDLLLGSEEAGRIRADKLRDLVQKFPQGVYTETNESGHFIQNDEPELVLALLRKLMVQS